MSPLGDKLLQEIGTFIGLPDLAFDDDGYCRLQLQDQFACIVRHDSSNERLIIIAELASVSDIPMMLFESVLSFNALRTINSGPWIALNQETKTLFLADDFYLRTIQEETFQDRFLSFFKHYFTCQGFLNPHPVISTVET